MHLFGFPVSGASVKVCKTYFIDIIRGSVIDSGLVIDHLLVIRFFNLYEFYDANHLFI